MDSDQNFDVFKAYAGKKKTKVPLEELGDSVKRNNASNKEVFEMLNKMKRMHRDIELKLEESYQNLGYNPKTLRQFLENPDNFSNEQWEKIQVQRSGIIKKLENQLQISFDIVSLPTEQISTKVFEKTEKERKSKTRGARRNWISMR